MPKALAVRPDQVMVFGPVYVVSVTPPTFAVTVLTVIGVPAV